MGRGRIDAPFDLRQVAIVLGLPALFILAVQLRTGDTEDSTPVVAPPPTAPNTDTTDHEEDAAEPGADDTRTAGFASQAATITVAATGEILPHPSIVEFARLAAEGTGDDYSFVPMFASLTDTLERADLAICHLEVPVAPDPSQLSGYPSFGIPPEIGVGIATTGWERCTTASNHSNDKGTTGIVATIDALDTAGVGFSGTAREPAEVAAAPFSIVDGIGTATLSYTWGYNASAPAEPWMANVIDPDRILADAAAARASGADVVVVGLHWGIEYDTTGSADQRALAEQLLASSDVDLLIGHGPHVIQPVAEFDGEYALLSVGNLVANQGAEKPYTYDGMVASVTFHRDTDGTFRADPPVISPTWYDRSVGVVRFVDTALDDPSLAHLHADLQASRDRTAAIVGPYISAG